MADAGEIDMSFKGPIFSKIPFTNVALTCQ